MLAPFFHSLDHGCTRTAAPACIFRQRPRRLEAGAPRQCWRATRMRRSPSSRCNDRRERVKVDMRRQDDDHDREAVPQSRPRCSNRTWARSATNAAGIQADRLTSVPTCSLLLDSDNAYIAPDLLICACGANGNGGNQVAVVAPARHGIVSRSTPIRRATRSRATRSRAVTYRLSVHAGTHPAAKTRGTNVVSADGVQEAACTTT
jgi:hypothetical protein